MLSEEHLMKGGHQAGNQEAIKRPSRGDEEAIQRQSRGHQEAIKSTSRHAATNARAAAVERSTSIEGSRPPHFT
jgi:hypothetical protein